MKRSFNEAYKTWRNTLRPYSLTSIVGRALEVLHESTSNNIDELKKAPWHVLLIVKWACQDKLVHVERGQQISHDAMHRLRQALWDMPETIDFGISDSRPGHLFMRQLLRPQVDLQRRPTLGFLREAALLSSQPTNSRMRRAFEDRSGLSVEDFADLTYATYSAVISGKRTIPLHWFAPLQDHYQNAVPRYIELVSCTLTQLVAFCRGLPSARQHYLSEVFEFPVLKRYPFIRHGNHLACWYPAVFFRGAEDMAHAVLREASATYIEDFSKLFERHVLSESCLTAGTLFQEKDLLKFVPQGTRVTDGLLSFPGTNVYIEAKAGIFDESLMSTGHSDILKSRTAMLRKAIIQARGLSAGLHSSDIAPTAPRTAEEEFLLVVTSKEVSAGTGSRLSMMYGEDLNEQHGHPAVPLDHIYFLSIEDYERLMNGYCQIGGDLPGFLRRCVARDGEPSTSVFYFEQHLDAENVPHTLSKVVTRFSDEILRRLEIALPIAHETAGE